MKRYQRLLGGYELWIDPDEDRATATGVMHHRLIAYAHGEIDSLHEPVEIDHLTPIPWLNYPGNLEAVGPIEHGRRTRRRVERRRSDEAEPAL